MTRRYQNIEQSKLEFVLGVGKAGLETWKKGTKDYNNCVKEVEAIEQELAIRKQENNDD